MKFLKALELKMAGYGKENGKFAKHELANVNGCGIGNGRCTASCKGTCKYVCVDGHSTRSKY